MSLVKRARTGTGVNIAFSRVQWFFRKLRTDFERPVIVLVTDVFTHQSVQMAFVEYDDMIEQISPAVANPAFCYAVLPRAPEAAALWLDTETFYRADDFLIEIRSTVEDQKLGVES
jgi:hypothetical protein